MARDARGRGEWGESRPREGTLRASSQTRRAGRLARHGRQSEASPATVEYSTFLEQSPSPTLPASRGVLYFLGLGHWTHLQGPSHFWTPCSMTALHLHVGLLLVCWTVQPHARKVSLVNQTHMVPVPCRKEV